MLNEVFISVFKKKSKKRAKVRDEITIFGTFCQLSFLAVFFSSKLDAFFSKSSSHFFYFVVFHVPSFNFFPEKPVELLIFFIMRSSIRYYLISAMVLPQKF